MNWRGKPLVSLAAIVNLIGSTTTTSGLRIRSEIDHGSYPLGVKITDQQLARIKLERHKFHGDWNYTIRPTRCRSYYSLIMSRLLSERQANVSRVAPHSTAPA